MTQRNLSRKCSESSPLEVMNLKLIFSVLFVRQLIIETIFGTKNKDKKLKRHEGGSLRKSGNVSDNIELLLKRFV